MTRSIQTIRQATDEIISDFGTAYGSPVPASKRSFLRKVAAVIAGIKVSLYKAINWYFLQQFVSYASTKQIVINGKGFIPLLELGIQYGVGYPYAATRASYTFAVSVARLTGSIPINAQIIGPNGVIYLTTEAVSLDAATVYIDALATDEGTVGNLEIGDKLNFMIPYSGVYTEVSVYAELVRAVDAETWDAYRVRVKDRFRKQPQGGAPVDYELWAELVSGIINTYVYREYPGVVDVYCEATPESCGNDDGIPTSGQLDAVEASIQYDLDGLASRRPACAFVRVRPITRAVFNIEIAGFEVEQDYPTAVSAMEDALSSYFASREPYIPGTSVGPRRDRVTSASVSAVIQDICDAYNGWFSSVSVTKDGSEIVAYVVTDGEKAKIGTISNS